MIRKQSLCFVVGAGLAMAAILTVSCTGLKMPAAGIPATEAIPAVTQVVQAPAAEVAQPVAETTAQVTPTGVSSPTTTPTIESTPTQIPEPTATSSQEAEVYQAGSVDLDKIFPPGRGRELILMGCTGCHNFVPLVIVGFNEQEWSRNALDHRDRVSSMSDEDFATLYAYLVENFGPDDPVPDLPQALLEQWTSY